jgi:uncharacterized membrane protein
MPGSESTRSSSACGAAKTTEFGAGAILLAALGYAVGPMLLKRRLAELDPRPLMAGALAVAALALTPATLIAPPAETPSLEAIASLVVLGVFCTAAALVLFGALIAEVGPSRASVITYVAPVVAVTLGVAVLGERPGAGAIAGLLLIIAGSWLSTDGRMPPGAAALVTGVRSRRRRRMRPRHGLGSSSSRLVDRVAPDRIHARNSGSETDGSRPHSRRARRPELTMRPWPFRWAPTSSDLGTTPRFR